MSDVVYVDAKKDFLRNEILSKQFIIKKKKLHLKIRRSGEKQAKCRTYWCNKISSVGELTVILKDGST